MPFPPTSSHQADDAAEATKTVPKRFVVYRNGRCEAVWDDGSSAIIHPTPSCVSFFDASGIRTRQMATCLSSKARAKMKVLYDMRNRYWPDGPPFVSLSTDDEREQVVACPMHARWARQPTKHEDGSISLTHEHGEIKILSNGRLVETSWKCKVPAVKNVVTHMDSAYTKDSSGKIVPKVTVESYVTTVNNVFPKELLPHAWQVPVSHAENYDFESNFDANDHSETASMSSFAANSEVSYQSDLRLTDGTMVTVLPKAAQPSPNGHDEASSSTSATNIYWLNDEMPPTVNFDLGDGFGRLRPLPTDSFELQQEKEVCLVHERSVGTAWIGPFGDQNIEAMILLDDGRLILSSRAAGFWHLFTRGASAYESKEMTSCSFPYECLPENVQDMHVWRFVRKLAPRVNEIAHRQAQYDSHERKLRLEERDNATAIGWAIGFDGSPVLLAEAEMAGIAAHFTCHLTNDSPPMVKISLFNVFCIIDFGFVAHVFNFWFEF